MKTLLTLLTLCVVPAFSQSFFLDSFDQGDFSTGPTGASTITQTGDPEHILGEDRTVRLYNGSTGSASVSAGELSYTRTENTILLLNYGSFGDANDATHLHADLSNYRLELTATTVPDPFTIHAEIYDYDGVGGHYFGGADFSFSGPGTVGVDFEDFGGGIDLTDVAGVQINFVSDPFLTGTFAISQAQITPVPEPEAYAAIAALGLLGFAIARRRSI